MANVEISPAALYFKAETHGLYVTYAIMVYIQHFPKLTQRPTPNPTLIRAREIGEGRPSILSSSGIPT